MYEFLIAIFAGAFILGIGFFASSFIALRIKRMDNEQSQKIAEHQFQCMKEGSVQLRIQADMDNLRLQHSQFLIEHDLE